MRRAAQSLKRSLCTFTWVKIRDDPKNGPPRAVPHFPLLPPFGVETPLTPTHSFNPTQPPAVISTLAGTFPLEGTGTFVSHSAVLDAEGDPQHPDARQCCQWRRHCVDVKHKCALKDMLRCQRHVARGEALSQQCTACMECKDNAAAVNKERLIEASLEELPVDDKDRCVPQLEQASAETQESALRDANIYLVCESVHYECLERRDRLGMCVLSEYEKTLQGNLGRFGQWCLLC